VKKRQSTRREAARRWSAKRFGLLVLVAVAIGVPAPTALAAPPYPAGAGLQDGGKTLSYVAGPSGNAVTVTLTDDNYTVSDGNVATIANADQSGTCTFGSGPPATATCPKAGVELIWVNAGNGSDTITVGPAIAIGAKLFGGAGNDQITSRNSTRDVVSCGGDSDTVAADALDLVNSDCETVDDGVPPETTIDPASGPPALTSDTTASFSFSSSELSTFECSINGSDFAVCTSPATYTDLEEGEHIFQVRAIDHSGHGLTDPTPAQRTWTVAVLETPIDEEIAPDESAGTSSSPDESLVLIAGRAVKVSRRGIVSVALNCSGSRDCAGTVILTTSKRVRYGKRKRVVRLASRKFEIDAGRTKKVRVRISRRKMRLLRRLRRIKTDVTVRERDRAGRARVGTRTILLKAPR
jgi:hypothetical protein